MERRGALINRNHLEKSPAFVTLKLNTVSIEYQDRYSVSKYCLYLIRNPSRSPAKRCRGAAEGRIYAKNGLRLPKAQLIVDERL